MWLPVGVSFSSGVGVRGLEVAGSVQCGGRWLRSLSLWGVACPGDGSQGPKEGEGELSIE